MKVLFLAAEVSPYIKVGGLADVARSLPRALRALGHDVRVAMPRYKAVDGKKFELTKVGEPFSVPLGPSLRRTEAELGQVDGVPTYLIWDEQYFGRERVYAYDDDAQRFVFWGRAALELVKSLDWQPDVIHANDWHAACVPACVATTLRRDPFFAPCATVYTIHNLAYHGTTGNTILLFAGLEGHVQHLDVEAPGTVNWMAKGIAYSDVINTVSPRYAQEILTPEYGCGMHDLLKTRKGRLSGILNGVDYELWNPATDPALAQPFDVERLGERALNKAALQRAVGLPVRDDVPLLGMVTRLVDMKGFDLLASVLDRLMMRDVQFVLLGTGDPQYEELFGALPRRFPQKAAVVLRFDEALAQQIYAGTDLFLMPSRFEPCGLGQIIAMHYGSLPVVRATGGLATTVVDYTTSKSRGTGFVFADYTADALWDAVQRALDAYTNKKIWRSLQVRAMKADFSWTASAHKYAELYEKAIKFHQK
ncbi:MAG: glycogen synthase GlgA [Thermoflexales bacterium]|nr:glycogen synthase GlgA [Thermoflexales bacterium]